MDVEDESPLEPHATLLVCPDCSEEVEVTRQPWAQEVTCPHCGGTFMVAALDGTLDPPDTELDEAAMRALDREAELDGLRIRNLSAARRAAYRSRSHAVIVGIACLIGSIQLIIMTVMRTRAIGWDTRCFGYAGFAVLGFYGALFFFRSALAMHREAKQSALSEPAAPPDLSTLSDGSQRWKDFENIR